MFPVPESVKRPVPDYVIIFQSLSNYWVIINPTGEVDPEQTAYLSVPLGRPYVFYPRADLPTGDEWPIPWTFTEVDGYGTNPDCNMPPDPYTPENEDQP